VDNSQKAGREHDWLLYNWKWMLNFELPYSRVYKTHFFDKNLPSKIGVWLIIIIFIFNCFLLYFILFPILAFDYN
jgi:Zn-dependent protease